MRYKGKLLYKGKKLHISIFWPLWFYCRKGHDASVLISLGFIDFLYRPKGYC